MIGDDSLPEYLEGDVVRLNPVNVMDNEFHYGAIPNVEELENGIVVKSDFSKQADQITYLVEFGNKEYWFLGHEIY